MKTIRRNRAYIALIMCVLLTVTLLLSLTAHARASGKTVRVGWYESPFNITDANGRRSGYAYEYQQKIAAYTGWTYEYVEGSWPNLMGMLARGEIDLMSDVSYTPERAQAMLYPDLPMGSEEYYLFIDKNNTEITADDFSTLNGKKIGANKGSVQIDFFRDWASSHNVEAEIVELTCSVEDALQMLAEGELDCYLALDSYSDSAHNIPLCRIGASDFFFVVAQERSDLLSELNSALTKINNEDRNFNTQLYAKYNLTSDANLVMSETDRAWLRDHGPIRVGYQDNYLAFCASDSSGSLTGALNEYLNYAADCIEDTHLDFETVAYPHVEDAMQALQKGEIDCVFPANLSYYDSETMGVVMTPALMRSEMLAVVRETEQRSFVTKQQVTVAVNSGNTNYDKFLLDHFPDWQISYFDDTADCLEAVAHDEVDCLLISNYRYSNISQQCAKLHLATVSTGVEMDYCFAVNTGSTELYSILSRVNRLVPASVVHTALNYYSTEDVKVSVGAFLRDHLAAAVAVIASVTAVILFLILRNVRSQQRADAGERLISATEHDELTGLYNRSFFYAFANRFYRENPNTPADAIVVNIDQFHSVNELHGREFGDRVLRELGLEIGTFLKEVHGIGSRLNVDDYYLFCAPQPDYGALLERFQSRVNQLSDRASIRLRMGVMPWQQGMEPVQMLDHAHTACGRVRYSDKHYVIYDAEMLEREHLSERLLNDLDRAIREHEFKVYYQPKFNVTVDPPVLSSAEALVRWQHPELGMVPPNKFIPLLEENGLIQQVDCYVWREVASQMQKWVEKYGRVFPVSVNVSRIDLYDPEFSTNIAALLKEFHIRREDFLLEITESAYTENSEQIVENVKKLREAGFFIEMDDFGSGYSSLNMISTLPIDIIKLDMEFIRNAFQGRSDTRMLEAVLGIAEMLYLPTVAEGVETQQQMQALRSMGCDVIQGYYFSKPVPAEEYEAFIEKRLSVPGEIPPVERSHHLPHLSDEDYSYDELHDPVTGLYNAPAFRLLAKDADQYHTALLLSEVVAEQGQDVTEQMIRHTAELLRRSFRPVDHICRIGNARFAIIMSRVDRSMQVQVEQKVARINDQLGSPEQQIPAVSLAVGVAFADRLAPGESILADAESALNGLLERGETGCAFH